MWRRLNFLRSDHIKISTKFAILFVIVGIFPLGSSAVISYTVYQSNIKQMTVDSAISSVEIVRNRVENLFREIERFLAIGESDIPMLFFDSDDDDYQYSKELLSLFKLYRTGFSNNRLIENIYVMGLNGKSLSERKGLYYKDRMYLYYNPFLLKILTRPGHIVILPKHVPDYDKDSQSNSVVSMGTVLYNNITLEPAGVILIDLNIEEIEAYYSDFRFMDIGKISLLYGHDQPDNVGPDVIENWKLIVTHFLNDSGIDIIRLKGAPHLFVNQSTDYNDLRVLGTISVNDMFSGVNKVLNYSALSLLISAMLIIYIFFIILRGLTRPLDGIQEKMHEAAQGNLDIEVVKLDTDMIPDLSRSFEKMLADLRRHLNTVDEEHRKYMDAELRVLQAQINPHFLYNTLDTILWSAVSDDNQEIVEMVSEMSKFFRISLSKGADYVTVADEVTCITSYLKIQRYRYRDILSFSIDVDEGILKYKMLKLILQPLVENALYHGIKSKRSQGSIAVSGITRKGFLVFEVSDDGVGIGAGRLSELRLLLEDSFSQNSEVESGVGLLNVQNRIKLKYGKEYGLSVESTPGQGTRFSIVLPILDE